MITQDKLMELAEAHEQKEKPASNSPQEYRKATCVDCEKPMTQMWHCWLKYSDSLGQHWVKEIHLCRECYDKHSE